MQSLRQILTGMLLALLSVAVVLGGFTLATVEGRRTDVVPTETPEPLFATRPPDLATQTEPVLAPTQVAASETPFATATMLVKATNTLIPSATITSLLTSTPLPSRTPWFAATSALPTLTSPPLGSWPTATYMACGAPAGWVNYYVVSGDTLYALSVRYGVTVFDLQRANCLGTSVYIQVGKVIKVPFVAATAIPYLSPTPGSSETPAQPSPTVEPTAVPPTTEVPTVEPPTVVPQSPEPPTATPYSGVG